MKRCRQCGVTKDFNDFSRNTINKDGYRYFCKVCEKENARNYYRENKDTVKSTVLKWRKEHPEDVQRHKHRYYKKSLKKDKIVVDNPPNPE